MSFFNQTLKKLVTQEPDTFINVIHGDCLEKIGEIEDESIHLVLTDPPYFLDGLDNGWTKGSESASTRTGAIRGLPVGMKFDPKQGRKLEAFIYECGVLILKALKPGGFAVIFSQPRLAHRMASGIEDSGFEIRDGYAWRFTKRAQFKAFSMDHLIDRMHVSTSKKRILKRSMRGKKTPQLRPQFESIILAQKPKDGTHVENWSKHQTGLINPSASLDGKVPSTIMTVEKPVSKGKREHLTPKPLQLIEHLILLFSKPGQVVLDPFLGSGTTALAAMKTKRSCVGIEINKDYINIAEKRLKQEG